MYEFLHGLCIPWEPFHNSPIFPIGECLDFLRPPLRRRGANKYLFVADRDLNCLLINLVFSKKFF